MTLSQARQTKSKRPKKKTAKKKTKKPPVRKVVVRREVFVDPYLAADPYTVYRHNPFGFRPWTPPPAVHPHYHYYQNTPRRVSAAAPAARSLDPAALIERVQAESAALRRYRAGVQAS